MQALRTAKQLADAPSLLPTTIRLAQKAAAARPSEAAAAQALDAALADLGISQGAPLSQIVDQTLQQHPGDAEWVLAAAEAKSCLGESASALLLQLVQNDSLAPTLQVSSPCLLERTPPSSPDTLLFPRQQLERAYVAVERSSSGDLETFRSAAAARFPLARKFKKQEEIRALDSALQQAKEGRDEAKEETE